jgi:hypothetical protein
MHTNNSSIASADAACGGGVKASDPQAVPGLSEQKIELCPLRQTRSTRLRDVGASRARSRW